MGKGDRRSKRGKLFRGTFGKSRKHKTVAASKPPVAAAEKEVKVEAPKKKAPRKKKTE